jgi:hypothetical protein
MLAIKLELIAYSLTPQELLHDTAEHFRPI